jgi:hypothetical protein
MMKQPSLASNIGSESFGAANSAITGDEPMRPAAFVLDDDVCTREFAGRSYVNIERIDLSSDDDSKVSPSCFT